MTRSGGLRPQGWRPSFWGGGLHSFVNLPVQRGEQLKGTALKAPQNELRGVEYIIIDKLSVVSQAQYAWMERRLLQAMGKSERTGDAHHHDGGSGGAADGWRTTPNPASALDAEVLAEYVQFYDVCILDLFQRPATAVENGVQQQVFIDCRGREKVSLPKMIGNCSCSDSRSRARLWRSRDLMVPPGSSTPRERSTITTGVKLKDIGTPVARCTADGNKVSDRTATADTKSGLERGIVLALGTKVMLTKNLPAGSGLVNGGRGTIVYAEGELAPALSFYDTSLLSLTDVWGENWFQREGYSGCALIAGVDVT